MFTVGTCRGLLCLGRHLEEERSALRVHPALDKARKPLHAATVPNQHWHQNCPLTRYLRYLVTDGNTSNPSQVGTRLPVYCCGHETGLTCVVDKIATIVMPDAGQRRSSQLVNDTVTPASSQSIIWQQRSRLSQPRCHQLP